ncbi:MAG: SsrA-binding protein SmpB [Bacteroidales bacterium]|nr:SsrA-binding protein SmpB [Bacteroidales bacterium]
MENRINIKNKKAYFDYEIIEKYVAGIQLTGTEIKSIRQGKASLADSYCYFTNNELWVKNIRISEYDQGSYNNHDPYRDRKLLLNRKELNKLEKKVREKGLTIVVLRLFINEKGLAKLDIGLSRGKKEYDKRESIKEKDIKRDMERMGKGR